MNNKVSETVTENIFRNFYGSKTFIEKSAISSLYGFKSKSKKETNRLGYPDFFIETDDFCVIVEAKPEDIDVAIEEVKFYMNNNRIKKSIIGMAIAGQVENELNVRYFYKLHDAKQIIDFGTKDCLLTLDEIKKQFCKSVYGDTITDAELTTVLTNLNKKFNDNNVRDTERSLFFSALMIALNNTNFLNTYKNIQAPSDTEKATVNCKILDAHYLNEAIHNAVTIELKDKINNLSKEFSWKDRFSFVKTIDIPLDEYKKIIEDIETKIFAPFKNDEKQDILGRAYRIFLKRAGKIDNKNIILTPDHIKALMVKLARLTKDDVVLDTCTGSGGFLMEAMETMVSLAEGNPSKIQNIKENQLIGFEIDYVLFSLACSNMFLHGDGRTNLLYRSSLLEKNNNGTYSKADEDLFNYIRSKKPTKAIINPPYENSNPIKFTMQAIDYLEDNGKLIVIMPTITLQKNIDNGLTEKLLEKAKLDFVIKMPANLFSEQSRIVYTSIFGFTKTPHHKDDDVLFYHLEDDGLITVQHKGRLDLNNVWNDKEHHILDTVRNSNITKHSEKKKIWDCENKKWKMYGVQNVLPGSSVVKFGDLFSIEKGSLQSSKCKEGPYTFITCSEEWKTHEEYTHDQEAIVYAVSASGSLGRAHYINGKFITSDLCLILTPKTDKYEIDLEFYTYILNSMRKQIVNDIGEGASKLVLKEDYLMDYYIPYLSLAEQKQYVADVKKQLQKIENLKKQISSIYADIDDFISKIV